MITSADIFKASILIVDDQAANIMVLEQMLGSAGYTRITSTRNPREVCELYRQHSHDLILLDLQMPGMDGFQVLQSLKEIESSGYLPVLVLTAEPEHKVRALKAGAKDFVSKPFGLAEILARVYNMLEVRLLHQETRRLYAQVVAEQKLTERLLLNVLPETIADRLKGRPGLTGDSFTERIVDSFPEVTVLFADIVGFTQFSEGVSPETLVDVLNDIFTRFDGIADRRGLEKIKTIGDSYMAAAGLPIPVADHSARAAHMALDLIELMDRLNEHNPHPLRVRIGLSTGAVVAGVIGKRKFLYDLWGDAVNTASRMESHGVSGRIQLTESTKLRLNGLFSLEDRGTIHVKGKGEMHTWFLNGRSASPFSLPALISSSHPPSTLARTG